MIDVLLVIVLVVVVAVVFFAFGMFVERDKRLMDNDPF